jgi:hypothetical protein
MSVTTIEKALRINLDSTIYGTIAEIGAGQEVARNFFLAGGAAGTIAKSMSAYDMQVSDEIYGEEPGKRYVCYSRVKKMIDREYSLVVNRLEKIKSTDTRFFGFADTVSAKGFKEQRDYHGWMGIKFQSKAKGEANELILHVRMMDRTSHEQQLALGILGINLIYAAFYLTQEPEKIIESLVDNLGRDRIEIDMIKFTGPDFNHLNNKLLALHLVKSGISRSILFTAEGEPIQALDLFYKKNVLVLRGNYRPFTLVHADIIKCGREAILKNEGINPENLLCLAEISMQHLIAQGNLNTAEYLARIEMLNKMGLNVQISDYLRTFRLKEYLVKFTKQKIDFIMGIKDVVNTFTEHYYEGLPGEVYEGLGILFSGRTRVYVYPKQLPAGEIITLDNIEVEDEAKYMLKHFIYNKRIEQITSFKKEILPIRTKAIREEIENELDNWKNMVPPEIAKEIESKKLFGKK